METNFFEIRNDELMRRAIARALLPRPRVRCVNAAKRLFYVEPREKLTRYLVTFQVTPGGKKLAACEDRNGEPCRGLNPRAVCYHVASAAAANIYVQTCLRERAAAR